MKRRAIVVLGPHRSGTSVVSRALLCAGAHLGQHLLDPNEDNPRGFFENSRIVEFNDRLLKHLALCWDYFGELPDVTTDDSERTHWMTQAQELIAEEFADAPLIGIKDPRLCLLAGFWRDALEASGFEVDHILVLRHPGECALSQQSRQQRNPSFHYVGAELDEGVFLWARYATQAFRYLIDKSFAFAPHAALLRSPRAACGAMLDILGLEADSTALDEFDRTFVTPDLHRHDQAQLPASKSRPVDDAIRIFEGLSSIDAGSRQRGDILREAAASLEGLLRSEACHRASMRVFVRARHTAVEANLELAEAKRIIAYQEGALVSAQGDAAKLREHLIVSGKQLVEARRIAEGLRIQQTVRAATDDGPAT